MAQAHQLRRSVRFGVFELDCRSGELRKSGIRIKLQEQPFRILALLLERPGDLVTRKELRDRLWPDGTVIDFDHSLGSAINKLRTALSDPASNPRFVETLPRRGLRFIAPIEKIGIPKAGHRTTLRWPPPHRSLAVLPFVNLSGDPEQAYFCDGMTDALITDLASIRTLRVVSRMSVAPFRDTGVPAPDIGRRLNVRHLVEGSVLREGERLRITVRLIDSMKDQHVWANSYEGNGSDVIALQREVAQAVAGEVRTRLTERELDLPSFHTRK